MENHIWNCFTICFKYYYNFISLQLALFNLKLEDYLEGMLSKSLLKEGVGSLNMNNRNKDQRDPGVAENVTSGQVLGEAPRVQGHEFLFRLHTCDLYDPEQVDYLPQPSISSFISRRISNDISIAWIVKPWPPFSVLQVCPAPGPPPPSSDWTRDPGGVIFFP